MMHDRKMDEIFGQLLPSASAEQVEAARWRVFQRMRDEIAAGRRAAEETFIVNHGDYHILFALEGGERHAYAISRAVDELTEGSTRFGPGTLFTSISRLLTGGMIEEAELRPDLAVNEEPRQYYRLTSVGRNVLSAESRRLVLGLFNVRAQHLARSV